MAIHPGTPLQRAEDRLLGLSGPLPAPGGGTSLNQRWSDAVARLFHDRSRESAIRWLTTRMGYEVETGGVCGEDWGGYGRIILGAATIAMSWALREQRGELYSVGLRWLDHAVRLCALLAIHHRDTALVVSPGCRQRVPTVASRDLWLQAMLGLPRGSYGWQVDPPGAELVGLTAAEIERRARYTRSWQGDPRPGQEPWILGYRLAERLDMVSPETRSLCRAWVERGEGLGDLVRGLRVHWPTVVRRYVDGSVAAWTPAVGPGILPPPDANDSCWDAPVPAAVGYSDGSVAVAQPPGIGPSAARDLQYWSGDQPQRAVGGGELVATIRARRGLGHPREDQPVESYVRRLALPRVPLLAEVRLGRGEPVVERGDRPEPSPPPPSGYPLTGPHAEMIRALERDLDATAAWSTSRRLEWARRHFWIDDGAPAGVDAATVEVRQAVGVGALAEMRRP